MIPESEWKWQGYAGHLIVAQWCLFHMNTVVGEYIVSTVGDYRREGDGPRTTIGAGKESFFETYVFKGHEPCGTADCKCETVTNFGEIDGSRWATPREAQAGHMAFCRKYAAL